MDAIGRTGEGPGEYTWPVLLRRSADTLSILDTRAFRLTTIRGSAIATTKLPFMVDDFALLPDGRHVYKALSSEPDRIGHPLHLYDEASGRITRSFGGEGVRADRSDRRQMVPRRRVAVAADGNIWAAHNNRYHEELYDTVIEVLDTRSGSVLGRTRVDARVVGLVGRDGFCSYAKHSELGESKFVVWSVALSGIADGRH